MKRREFLQLAASTGLGVLGSHWLQSSAFAQSHFEPYTGKLYLSVWASGGWDPTSLCDPKGWQESATDREEMNQSYAATDIAQAGNIRYAPLFDARTVGDKTDVTATGEYANFFEKHYARLLVINGIDCGTNGHAQGARGTFTGNTQEGYPAFGALYAANKAPDKVLGFLGGASFDHTAELIPAVRVGTGSPLYGLSNPNDTTPDGAQTYHAPATWDRLQLYKRQRLERLKQKDALPSRRTKLDTFEVGASSEAQLKRFTELLPASELAGLSSFQQRTRVILAAYRAGLCASSGLSTGGFDTHTSHDTGQLNALRPLLFNLDFLIEEIARQDLSDKVVVVVGSDFGRTPGYNADRGKDHWSVTSMILFGAGVTGNRVIGATTERHAPHKVNPATLTVDDENGVRITTAHVNQALRKFAGVADSPLATRFPLKIAEELALF